MDRMYPFQHGHAPVQVHRQRQLTILDPTNQITVDDGMGHTNSVYTCVP